MTNPHLLEAMDALTNEAWSVDGTAEHPVPRIECSIGNDLIAMDRMLSGKGRTLLAAMGHEINRAVIALGMALREGETQ